MSARTIIVEMNQRKQRRQNREELLNDIAFVLVVAIGFALFWLAAAL